LVVTELSCVLPAFNSRDDAGLLGAGDDARRRDVINASPAILTSNRRHLLMASPRLEGLCDALRCVKRNG
jgi:hypothetical protein